MVISDDEGPEGATWSILSEHARSDPRIRVIENHRGRGQVENTNNAMLACRGDWIKVLHDDDWLAPGSLATFARIGEDVPRRCVHDLHISFRSGQRHKVPARTPGLSVFGPAVPGGSLSGGQDPVAWDCPVDPADQQQGRPGRLPDAKLQVDQLGRGPTVLLDLACHGDMVAIDDGLVFYDTTNHASITAFGSFPQIDQETIELKHLAWSLLEDKAQDFPILKRWCVHCGLPGCAHGSVGSP